MDAWLNKNKKSELEHIDVVFVPTPRDELLTALKEGRGDIVAANLTITKERLDEVDFTNPVLKNVREILVTGQSAPTIRKLEDLSGKELYIRKSSSYYEHLVALNEEFKSKHFESIKLTPADENLEDEDLLEMVNAVDNWLGRIRVRS